MAKLRKRWSTTTIPGATRRYHESKAEAYRYVTNDRANWQAGALRSPIVRVWVDDRDGTGWHLYERVNFAEEVS